MALLSLNQLINLSKLIIICNIFNKNEIKSKFCYEISEVNFHPILNIK